MQKHLNEYKEQKKKLEKGTEQSQASGFRAEQKAAAFAERMGTARTNLKIKHESLKASKTCKLGDLVQSPSASASPSPPPAGSKGKTGKGGKGSGKSSPHGSAGGEGDAQHVAAIQDDAGHGSEEHEQAERNLEGELGGVATAE